MSPFDLREALLAKHAQHVVLIHFPIALLIVGVGLDILGHRRKRPNLEVAAYYNFVAAAISTMPAVVTGLLAWEYQLEEQRLKGILLEHLVFGGVSTLLIWVVWYIHFRVRTICLSQTCLPPYRLWVELLAVAFVIVTGHLGGFLSGVNGPG
jgi:uncharacterized membrane protein